MNYRRRWGTQIWHSSPECPHWPHSELEAEERDERPATGETCPDCERMTPKPPVTPQG